MSGSTNPTTSGTPRLSRRDWIVMSALAFATVLALAIVNQLLVWNLFTFSETFGEDCLRSDPVARVRGIPNSVCHERVAEGEAVDYVFNSDGYRNAELQPKAPGVYRIAILGSSVAAGFRVPQQDTLAARLQTELASRTGRQFEVLNLSLPGRTPYAVGGIFDEFLATQPDLILWVLTPFDIQTAIRPVAPAASSTTAAVEQPAGVRAQIDQLKTTLRACVVKVIGNPHSSLLLRNLLYRSPSQFLKASLAAPDSEVGFLQRDLSDPWQRRLAVFRETYADAARRAQMAGVPLVSVLAPDRAQATLIALRQWPENLDPYKLNAELRAAVTESGGVFIDILPDYEDVPDAHDGYFPVDGHPNSAGHATLARFIAQDLVGAGVVRADRGE
jgi:hypothetical protein